MQIVQFHLNSVFTNIKEYFKVQLGDFELVKKLFHKFVKFTKKILNFEKMPFWKIIYYIFQREKLNFFFNFLFFVKFFFVLPAMEVLRILLYDLQWSFLQIVGA